MLLLVPLQCFCLNFYLILLSKALITQSARPHDLLKAQINYDGEIDGHHEEYNADKWPSAGVACAGVRNESGKHDEAISAHCCQSLID